MNHFVDFDIFHVQVKDDYVRGIPGFKKKG
jgi:hypothetical protein